MSALMPPLLHPHQTQFSAEEANRARIITKTRWIMEARNGHIKSLFKFFANMISTSHIPNLGDFIKIAIPFFPVLTLEYLHQLTYGTYQIGLAPSYIQDSSLRAEIEHEEDDEDEELLFEIDLNAIEPGFVRIRIGSRFRNAVKHQLWISFNDEHNENYNENPILGYYCTCKAGARTLGSCAHVAAVIWYLGYARLQDDVRYPSLKVLRSVPNATVDVNQLIEIIDPLPR